MARVREGLQIVHSPELFAPVLLVPFSSLVQDDNGKDVSAQILYLYKSKFY
jgi:hypothetical protein